MFCSPGLQWPPCITQSYLWDIFCPNFLSVRLSWTCPWREWPTTDAAEILPVKVFLIINAGPPYWQNSRLPVDGHHISLTHCHELFSQNMLTLAYMDITCLYTNTHTWRKHESSSGHADASVLTCLIKYNRCTCTLAHAACLLMTQCIQQSAGHLQYLSCR